ncbi:MULTISPECIES: exosortase/archaeosortase family protein [unclassified Marinobacter]|uniref:exosortase/archaeosortase family protein n=1 Tax=unclassified Marinobacter TaxID=83889 RepID=UPI00200CB865|nr:MULTISPECIES: exosortase/archaeosortase family protein [unclassified Marinobacter]UQG54150.1 exosortase/archaeosortase family protein [Marinobacter sp. M4C]UQG62957.1 exosortase/archaeosortase family protein [Marinobacter sp. M2C]UQG67235.1 exosortase/archaeosortase family protein [Marinobacter sp. M1C]
MLRKTLQNIPVAKPYLLATAIAVLIFFPTWLRLTTEWLEFEQVLAHGLATALIFLWLVITHPPAPNKTLTHQQRPFYKTGALALIVVTLGWAVLELARIDTLAYFALPAGVAGITWALLGWQRLISFLPYILVLSLSLPFWADLVPALVRLASAVVGAWVNWMNMPALIEGNSITVPYGRLVIEDGCSGIRYFAISILLAAMTSVLNDYRWRGWLASLSVAVTLALIVNWVRITILVVVGYQSEMQSDLLTDHELMGWLVYGAFLIPVMYFSPVMKRNPDSQVQPASTHKKGYIAIAVAVLIGPVALTLATTATTQSGRWSLNMVNSPKAELQSLPIPLSMPEALNQQAWFTAGTWVLLAQSQRTNAEDKLVPYLPPQFNRSQWLRESNQKPGATVYRHILTREQVVMAQWYQVGSYTTDSYRNAKLLQIPALLQGATRFALVTLQASCQQRSCESAYNAIINQKTTLQAQSFTLIQSASQ